MEGKKLLITVTSDFRVLFITEARGCVVFATLDGLMHCNFFLAHFNHKGEQFGLK